MNVLMRKGVDEEFGHDVFGIPPLRPHVGFISWAQGRYLWIICSGFHPCAPTSEPPPWLYR
jgi:hypothetical protein